MSIVAVHGPSMAGAGAAGGGTGPVVDNAGGTVTADMTNGQRFTLVGKGDRLAADYDWTFSDGTAAINNTKSTSVTFATGGSKTITLTVGTSGGTTPPGGPYTFVVTATATPIPRMVRPPQTVLPGSALTPSRWFDPVDHTVVETVEYAREHPDEVPALIRSEQAGKKRVSLLSQLQAMT